MVAANPATTTVASAGGLLSPGMKTGLAIMAAFVLYLIAANRLGVYIGILTGSVQTGSGTAGGTLSGVVTSVTGTPGTTVNATVSPTGGL